VRLFFAIAFPEPTLEALAQVVEGLRARAAGAPIGWEARAKLHVTSKFLGEVADEAVPALVAAARDVGTRHRPFELTVARLSAFPSEASPRILWLGIGEGSDAVAALAKDVDAALAPLGFERESRPYVPHVTLARTKGRAGERAARRLLEAPHPSLAKVSRTHVGAFVLMVSRKGTYDVLHAFDLGGGAASAAGAA
jgi:2'-5' RNA ligase